MVWTSDVPNEEEHPGVTMAASAVLIVIGLLALWGAWKLGVFTLEVTREMYDFHESYRRTLRRTRDGAIIWWGITGALGLVGLVMTGGGVGWFMKGASAELKGERVK